MDCDLQHDETRVPLMLAALNADETLDLAIGSRNVDGGSAGDGLSKIRKWGSDVATNMTAGMLKISASDPMSGFFMVRRSSFNTVVTELQTDGFKILADMLSASRGAWNITEIPFTFRKRQHGESKMDSAVAMEFLGLLLARFTGGMVSIRFVLFMLVGLSGVLVQLIATRLGLLLLTDTFLYAQTFGVIVAMTSNFVFNNALTYRDRSLKGFAFFTGLLSFYAVCAVGAIANVGVANSIFSLINSPEIAGICGALVGALWNFFLTSLVTWRRA
jgi:dolichol-phosphate mannosyltransferase